MPSIETTDLKQVALLWTILGVNDLGEKTYNDPIEIDVRWEEKNIDIRDAQSNTLTIDALAVVDREIDINSLMCLTTESAWNGTGSNDTDNGLMQVIRYNETPDIKNRKIRRTVYMIRYKNIIP